MMTDERYARWSALVDAETAGTPMTDEERAFCDGVEEQSRLARAEAELLARLGDAGDVVPPDASARAIIDGALAKVADGKALPDVGMRSARERRSGGARWRVLVLTGGLSAAMAAVLVAMAWLPRMLDQGPVPAPAFRAELVYASGDVRVAGRASADHQVNQHANQASVLPPGTTVTTGEGHACLVLDPGIDVCAGPHSALQVAEPSATERGIRLERGLVSASLSPQPAGTHFVIHAGEVSAKALGTVFSVRRDAGGDRVETLVGEGVVAVARDAQQVMVRAHERVRIDGPTTHPVSSVSRMEEAHLRASLVVAELWHKDLSSTLEVQTSDPLVVKLDGEPIGTTPLRAVVPAGHRTVSVGDGPPRTVTLTAGEHTSLRFEPAATRPSPEPPNPEGSQAEASEAPARPRVLSPAARLERARGHAVGRRFAGAAREYEALRREYEALRREHPRSPEAHAGLVTLGELRLSNLDQPQQALSAFERYLRRGGPLAHEALHGKIRALRALGRQEAEATAIGQLLARYPGSPHRQQLQKRRSSLVGQGLAR